MNAAQREAVQIDLDAALRSVVSRPYVLEAVDRAGCVWVEGRFATFPEMLAASKALRADLHPLPSNRDRADCDSDGLTEEERDAWLEGT